MDLLSSIRKTGSRGGVDFKWDDVQTSSHRENYLGHSLMAPVGRWAKNRDLSWYAKGNEEKEGDGETAEQRKARERKEEIRKIKEAEEDALQRALGLPVKDRGTGTGANGISVGEMNKLIKDAGEGTEGTKELAGQNGFAEEWSSKAQKEKVPMKNEGRSDSRERRHRRHRHRSRSGEKRRHRSGSEDRHRVRRRHDERRRDRSRSPRERRPRSRSPERRHRSRSPVRRPRSRSPVRRHRSRSPVRRPRSRSPERGSAYRDEHESRRDIGDRPRHRDVGHRGRARDY